MKTRKTIALMLALLLALAALPWQGAAGAGPNTTDVSFWAEQTGGEDGKKDSTGIKLTFSQEVTGLTPDKITIESNGGEATKGSRLTSSGREWTIELAGVGKQGAVVVRVADFDGFHITNENGAWQTLVYRGPYNATDIGIMNSIIENNKPAGMTKAPVNGSSIPASWIGKVIWGDAYPKRIKEINLRNTGMTGRLDVNELPALETLDCSDNQLVSLRLDALPALSWVDCSINKLTTIQVSGLPALQTLYCYGNLLSSLPTDRLTSLKTLNISSNQLSQLFNFSVSNLTALTDLNCSYNQLSGIFDVSGLTALTWLNCRNNQLTGVSLEPGAPYRWLIVSFNDMTDESAVTGKDIKWDGGNFSFHPQYVYPGFTAEQTGGANGTKTSTGIKLTFDRDDIWGLTEDKITLTNCTGEAIKGSEVTGSGNTWNLKLAQVTKPGDVLVSIADFKNFRVMGNPRPATVHKAGTRTYAVTVTGGTANGRSAVSAVKDAVISLTADAAPAGQHFIEWNILPEVQFTDGTGKQSSTAKFIMPAGDVTAEAIYAGEFNRADIAVINNIITVNGWNVPKAPADGASVPDEWYGKVYWSGEATNKRVTHLEIGSAGLTGTLDVSGLSTLYWLVCPSNQLTGLNVSGLTVLEYLDCRSNQLTGFNVSGLPRLQALFYTDNQLTGTLNVSGLPMLESFDCDENQLTGLDVSGLPMLKNLDCSDNQLTGLALNQGAPYDLVFARYNYMANTDAITGRTLNWDSGKFLFSPQYRRVSYDAHGGSGQMQADRATDGVPFMLPQNRFTAPSGKRFDAWAIGDASGQMKKAGEQHIFNADTTLYAIWYDPVTGVTLNKNTATLTVGGSETLTATVAPENATYKDVTWSSDKPAVAAVDQSGKVTAVGGGAATITVKTKDGEKTATCAVTVVAPVTGVKLNKAATSMVVGGAETLYATVEPGAATNKNVTWSSDKPAVAAVDQSGKVTAVGVGAATITVKTADGEKTATCAVTVSAAPVAVTGVALNKTATGMVVGATETLTATVAPENATNQNVAWSSDKPGVASVDQSGKVTAVAPGAATVTVKTADGEKTASCSVTVRQAAPFTGAVTFDKDTVKTGEPVTATWSLSGGVPPYSVSAYSWYVREEGSGTKILEKSGGAAAVGSLSFTPTKGKALMLELDLRDSADQLFQYSSDWIPISGGGSPDTSVKGDANGDNSVDIRDLVSIINYIVSGIQPKSTEGADANGDGDVDIRDLVWVIKLIVG